MLRPRFTGEFRKDRTRSGRRAKALDKLDNLMRRLASEEKLEPRFRDHKLGGEGKDFRKCHVEPDWPLIYRTHGEEITFVRTGTHSDLFDEQAVRSVRPMVHQSHSIVTPEMRWRIGCRSVPEKHGIRPAPKLRITLPSL